MGQRRRGRDGVKEGAWRRWVGEQAASGLSVRAFCRQRELAESGFYFWRRKLQSRDAAVRPVPGAAAPARPPLGKIPVRRRASRPRSSPRPPAAFAELTVVERPPPTPIEIVLRDHLRIAVRPGFSRETLQAVLAVLQGAAAETARC